MAEKKTTQKPVAAKPATPKAKVGGVIRKAGGKFYDEGESLAGLSDDVIKRLKAAGHA